MSNVVQPLIPWAGRIKLFTDQTEITSENVAQVVGLALINHNTNAIYEQYLIDYEQGKHPILDKVKEVRP